MAAPIRRRVHGRSFLIFGTGVYVADPDEIKAMFTGDQSDLLAGEANAPLAPVLGEHSVLVLDGPEHLRQRKLLLPPFQGSAVPLVPRGDPRRRRAEIDGWRAGDEFPMRERMRALTFEVICRAVFGVTEPERVERLRAALLAVIDLGARSVRADLAARRPRALAARGACSSAGWRRPTRCSTTRSSAAAREPDLEERTDVLSLLLRARDEDGQPMTDVELRDELMTMLAAGHETTATGLAFAFDLLPRHPRRARAPPRRARTTTTIVPRRGRHRDAADPPGDRRRRAHARRRRGRWRL